MTRLTKCLAAAAVVAGFGFASQTASAHPPTVIVHPTVRPVPAVPVYSPFAPRPLVYTTPYTVNYPIAPRHDHDYVVLHRPSPFGGWELYGKFETRHGAESAQRRLEWQGIPTRVIRACDYSTYRW
jgi:hypothetical protein